MLINTVTLFLRDALPMFVVLTILLSLLNQQGIKHRWCYLAGIVGLLGSMTMLASIDTISNAFDGTGREWLYALCYMFCYCATLYLIDQTYVNKNTLTDIKITNKPKSISKIRYCAMAILSMIIMLKSAHFLIYITVFWTQNDDLNVLLTGMILGAGICTSIAILLYFLMDIINVYYRFIRETLLVLFNVGLLMQSSNLLLQIDALPSGNLLWDSNDIVLENSEMGQLLNVFFGYDATPTLIQLLLYVLALVIAFSLIFIRTRTHVQRLLSEKHTPHKELIKNNAKEAL